MQDFGVERLHIHAFKKSDFVSYMQYNNIHIMNQCKISVTEK